MNASFTHCTSTITTFPHWQGASIPEYPKDIKPYYNGYLI